MFCLSVSSFASAAQDAGAHYIKADVINQLTDNAKCPGWTDTLKWEIRAGGDCITGSGSFTALNCLNDQSVTINPGGKVSIECDLSELPPGDLEKYCLKVTWCEKNPIVSGFLSNSPVNQPPLASLKVGFEFYTTSKEAAVLAGGGQMGFWAGESKDTDGSISSYRWDFGDGQTAETPDPVAHHGYASPGTYTASLVAVDDKGAASPPDTAKITVSTPPVTKAYAGTKLNDVNYNEVTAKPGETVYFDSSRSSSAKGIKGYVWVYASAEQAKELLKYLTNPDETTTLDMDKTANPSRSFTCNDKECDYSAVLLIDEGEGLKNDGGLRDSVKIKVVRDPATSPITAVAHVGTKNDDAKHDKATVNFGDPVYYVDQSTSTSSITSRTWYFPETNEQKDAVKDQVETKTYTSPGTYKIMLYVENEKKETDDTEVSVDVVSPPGNKPPTADIKPYFYDYYKEKSSISKINAETYDPKYLEAIAFEGPKTIRINKQMNKMLMFSADGSKDEDGSIVQYSWKMDGLEVGDSSKEAFLNFANVGEHTIEVSVVDNQGGIGKDSLKVIVEGAQGTGSGLDVFFVPEAWIESDESFDSYVESVKDFRKLLAPGCPEKIRLTNARKECTELQGDFLLDYDKSMLSILDCSNRLGRTIDYVVLVSPVDLGKFRGFSTDILPIILVTSKMPIDQSIHTLAHESGHQLGLGEEYYDFCRCVRKVPNCLDATIGGSDGIVEKQCAGGSECSLNAVCKGNLNIHGGRCIMSAVADISYEPREFCPICASYLAGLPQLKCN